MKRVWQYLLWPLKWLLLALIFFSPAGIESLTKNFPNFEQGDIAIGCFGPATAKAVNDAGLRLDLEAPTEKYPSMTGALQHYLLMQEDE